MQPDANKDPAAVRGRIVAAAAAIYARIGHGKTTVADIARALSMSHSNVYRFFPSKRAIEERVAHELLRPIAASAAEAAAGGGPAAQRLHAVLQTVARQHERAADHAPRLYQLIAAALREDWPVARAYTDRLHATLAKLIAGGQAAGEFRAGDPAALARCVLAATSAYLHPLATPASPDVPRPTLIQMTDFCLRALPAEGARQHLAA